MLVLRGRVVDPKHHFLRMFASAEALGFPLPDGEEFIRVTKPVVGSVAGESEAVLRCYWLAVSEREWQFAASASSIPPLTRKRRRGATLAVLDRSFVRSLPEHKLTSWAVCDVALSKATRLGANEALFLDEKGRVLEGTATNVFAIAGGKLVTAPDDVLPGIVRQWVLENAEMVGLTVVLRPPTIDELLGSGFVTGSLTTLAPIVEVGGVRAKKPPAEFEELRTLYLQTRDDTLAHRGG